MDLDSEFEIPVIDLSRISPHCDRGSQEWQNLCKKVKEACETSGFFEVVYDKISIQLRAQTFSMIRQVFELPLEIKKKNYNPKPYHGYAGQYAAAPLYESLGIEHVSNFDSLNSFTQLLWPHGLHQFCEMIGAMIKGVDELHKIIEMMIIDSYGLGEKSDCIMECKTLARVMKYKAPPTGEYMDGLDAHTDKPMSALLLEDQVCRLEVETKHGEWIKLFPSPNSLVFIVGDPLMAWSNGRMHAVKHRVMMMGDKDRYSLGAFAVPIEGTIIKPPQELIDEYHPQILEEFDYWDFLRFSYSKEGMAIQSAQQLFAYAGNSEQGN